MTMAKARTETNGVFEAAGRAAAALRYFNGRVSNGFGELSDPSAARASLMIAKNSVEAALQALDRAGASGWTPHDD